MKIIKSTLYFKVKLMFLLLSCKVSPVFLQTIAAFRTISDIIPENSCGKGHETERTFARLAYQQIRDEIKKPLFSQWLFRRFTGR